MSVQKLSEMLAEHPHLDMDIDVEGKLTMDAVIIVRLKDPEDNDTGIINVQSSEHTDPIIKRGLLHLALSSMDRSIYQDDDD